MFKNLDDIYTYVDGDVVNFFSEFAWKSLELC